MKALHFDFLVRRVAGARVAGAQTGSQRLSRVARQQ
jgi:hypothetical protein